MTVVSIGCYSLLSEFTGKPTNASIGWTVTPTSCVMCRDRQSLKGHVEMFSYQHLREKKRPFDFSKKCCYRLNRLMLQVCETVILRCDCTVLRNNMYGHCLSHFYVNECMWIFSFSTGSNTWVLEYLLLGLCAAFLCVLFHWFVCLLCCLTQELPNAFIVEHNEGCFYHHLPAGQRWEWRQMGQVYNDEHSVLNLETCFLFIVIGDNPERNFFYMTNRKGLYHI